MMSQTAGLPYARGMSTRRDRLADTAFGAAAVQGRGRGAGQEDGAHRLGDAGERRDLQNTCDRLTRREAG